MTVDFLVTGADGQLGHEIVRLSKARRINFIATTRSGLDITSRSNVEDEISRTRPKVVINAAAYTAVDKAETDETAAFSINRDGPQILAETASDFGAAIIHLSTDYVFDGTKSDAYVEEDPVSPVGVYGKSKEAGERAVRDTNCRHLILRTAWVFNTHGNNFVKTMLRLNDERREIRVVDDQRGCPTYAVDLADAVLTLAERITKNEFPKDGFGTFHCAGTGQTTWYSFARKIFEFSRKNSASVIPVSSADYSTPAKRPINSVLDCTRLEEVHGLRLPIWFDALAEMLSRLERD